MLAEGELNLTLTRTRTLALTQTLTLALALALTLAHTLTPEQAAEKLLNERIAKQGEREVRLPRALVKGWGGGSRGWLFRGWRLLSGPSPSPYQPSCAAPSADASNRRTAACGR